MCCVQVLPPSVDLKIRLVSLWGKPPPPSSMPAMYMVPSPDMSPVICTSRMKVPVLLTVTGAAKWRRYQWRR